MLIAVTYENNNVFQHFGHTENFKLYQVEDSKILSSSVVPTLGQGHGALATFLKEKGVDTLICGGIGQGAINALEQADIKVYPGVKGNCDTVVDQLLNHSLIYNPDTKCDHHKEGHSHDCSSHGCH